MGAATGGLAILAEGVLSDPQSSGDEKASVHGWAPITVGLGALASAGLVTVGLIASGNDAE